VSLTLTSVAFCEERPLLLYIPVAVWATMLVIDIFCKPYIKQPRPMNLYSSPCTAGAAQNGMPSGHSAIAVVVACIVTMCTPEAERLAWGMLSGAWYLLVVTSRLAFLYHTPAQVFFGTLVGVGVTLGFSVVIGWPITIDSRLRGRPPMGQERCLLAGLCAVVTLAWTPFCTWPASSTGQVRAVAALVCTFAPFVFVAVNPRSSSCKADPEEGCRLE
jgi:hypothetical protein